MLIQEESEPAHLKTPLQSGEGDILARVVDFQGGLIEAGEIILQALSLILSNIKKSVRSQMSPTIESKVKDKEASELVEGVHGIRFQPYEPSLHRAMKSHQKSLAKEGI